MTSVIAPLASLTASSFGITNPVYDGRFSWSHARHDLVAQLRIEVHAVGFEQRPGRRRSRLRDLIRCTSASRRPTPSRNAADVRHHVVRLAVAHAHVDRLGVAPSASATIIWRLRMWSSSICVPCADAAQLDERVARVALRTRPARSRPGPPPAAARARRASDRAGSTAPPDRRALPRAPSTAPSARSAACRSAARRSCPDAWPITSCMFVVSSPANAPHFSRARRFLGVVPREFVRGTTAASTCRTPR